MSSSRRSVSIVGLEPQLRLGLAEFGLPGAFARRVERPLLLGALAAEPVEVGASRPRTSSLCRRRCSASTPCSTSTVARWRSTTLDQPVDHAERPLDLRALAGRRGAGLDIGRQPALGLGELLLEQLLALVQPGVAHLEIACGATTVPPPADRVRRAARRGHAPRRPRPARRIRGRAAAPPARRCGAAHARPILGARSSVGRRARRARSEFAHVRAAPGRAPRTRH